MIPSGEEGIWAGGHGRVVARGFTVSGIVSSKFGLKIHSVPNSTFCLTAQAFILMQSQAGQSVCVIMLKKIPISYFHAELAASYQRHHISFSKIPKVTRLISQRWVCFSGEPHCYSRLTPVKRWTGFPAVCLGLPPCACSSGHAACPFMEQNGTNLLYFMRAELDPVTKLPMELTIFLSGFLLVLWVIHFPSLY